MSIDPETAVAAMRSRDPRFDGLVYVAVTTTGVYCRPSCPAVMPKPENTRFYPSAAAAQVNGFRACKRCRPDAAVGSAAWNTRGDVVGRAMRLIGDGVVDAEGVGGLARRLGYSVRQVHRLLVAEVGAGPQAVARARRAQAARVLVETTSLPVADVAFAAGFASVRQFNETMRAVFDATPTGLRAAAPGGSARSRAAPVAPGAIRLRLAYRAPLDLAGVLATLGAYAVPGIEEYADGVYRRALRLPHGPGIVAVQPEAAADGVPCELRLSDPRDLATAVDRVRRLLDLDADAPAIDERLGADPLLGPLVRARPGRRVPGSTDPAETGLRAALGEVGPPDDAVRDLIAHVVKRHGLPLDTPVGAVTHTFPDPAALAERPDGGLPPWEREAVFALARALSDGSVELGPGVSWERARHDLTALPLGPEAVDRILVHGLGDPDVLVRRPRVPAAWQTLDPAGTSTDLTDLTDPTDRWRPWRSYASHYVPTQSSTSP